MSKHARPQQTTATDFDRVTMMSPRGQMTTLYGDLPYRISGFDWQFVTERANKVSDATGCEAVGTVSGETLARGVVDDVYIDETGLAEVFVGPP